MLRSTSTTSGSDVRLPPQGMFRAYWEVEYHYDRFKDAFLQCADHGNVKPGALDLCISNLARNKGQSGFPNAQH